MANWVLGLTGGIGSGKTAASDFLASLGVVIVDADIVAREVVEPGSPALTAIADYFGPESLLENGGLNRPWLRQQVFDNAEQRKALESITHPAIRQRIIDQLEAAKSPYVVLASPLLFETNQHALTTRTLVIDVPEDVQLQRAASRDNNSEDQIRKIIASQLPREQRCANAHDVIENTGTVAQLHQRLLPLHQYYLQQAAD